MATFVLDDDAHGAGAQGADLAKVDMDSVPAVDETIEIKGRDYVVCSRRWKAGRLTASVTVVVRSVLETTV